MNGNFKTVMAITAAMIFTACSKNQDQSHPSAGQMELTSEMVTETEAVAEGENMLRSYGSYKPYRPLIISRAAMIDSAISKFRNVLGPLNWNATHSGGRREINWDDVALFLTNNNSFPSTYYNRTDAGGPYDKKLGLIYTTPGSGFRVSNNNFSDIDTLYRDEFIPYSPSKNMTALGSNIIDIHFKVPGTDHPGYVNGFGAVFNDVNIKGSTSVSLYSGYRFLGNYKVKIADTGEPSFIGFYFPGKKITRARIKLGSAPLGNGLTDVCDGGNNDLVTLDDLIYTNPKKY